jgi:hypothetical protein
MINVLACRGMNVDSSENASLSKWNRLTPYFRCNEGLFIYEGGFVYPKNHPWPFPYFPKPKMIVEYMGEFAGKTEEMEATEEIDTEIIPDFSKYNSLCQSLIGYEVDREISRYNIPDGGIPDDAS